MAIPENPITREEKYLDAMVKALDGGGGGGGSGDGVMVVNLTPSGGAGNYTADKTMGEIRAAMAEGKPAFLFYDAGLLQRYYAISETTAYLHAVAINQVAKLNTSYRWGDNQAVDGLNLFELQGVSSTDSSTAWRTDNVNGFLFTNLLDYATIAPTNAPKALLFDNEDGPRWGVPPSITAFGMTDMSVTFETVLGTLKQQSAATGSASLAFYFEAETLSDLLAATEIAIDESKHPWMVMTPQSAPRRFWALSDTTFSNIANNLSSATFVGHDVDTEQSGGNLTAHLYAVSITFTSTFVYVKVDADTQTVIDPTTLLGGE